MEFRIVRGRVAEEGDAAPAEAEQMFADEAAAVGVVAADRDARLVRQYRAPADEVRALLDQPCLLYTSRCV